MFLYTYFWVTRYYLSAILVVKLCLDLRNLTNLKDTVGLTLREEQVGSSIQPVSEGERVDESTGRVFLIVEGHGTQVAQELTSR